MQRILAFTVLLGLSAAAWAEQGCPDGMYPGGRQPGPICIPIPGLGGGIQQPPTPLWEDRWGAIATDSVNGTAGFATNQRSKYLAEATALTQCRQSDNSACRVILVYANQCAVLVTSSDSHLVESGKTIEEATAKAMSECHEAGVECSVYYSACTLSQRVN